MLANDDRPKQLAQAAQRLMQQRFGQQVVLGDAALIEERGRSLVIRCSVQGHAGLLSVVVKHNTGDDERGFTDWASLQFLSGMEQANGIAPRFYAGDPAARIVVMEDLGGSRSLADVLDSSTEITVLETLRGLALPMARLVVATAGREHEFTRLRDALPGAGSLGRQHEAERWRAGRAKIEQWAYALGLELPAGFEAGFEYVADVFAEPGPFLAFSHGDPAPSNIHIAADRVRLVDFEYGTYRHALYDISGWFILCPLAEPWVAALTETFRHELAQSPLAHLIADDAEYREGWATICAYRALAMLTWIPPSILQVDSSHAPGWSRRQATISTCLRLHQVTAGCAHLQPLATFGARMAAAAQARWPELGNGAIIWPGVMAGNQP
jgi:hypothetical protein